MAASLVATGTGEFCWSRYVTSTPPAMTPAQQHILMTLMNGRPEMTPMNRPPRIAGWYRPIFARLSVVVFAAQMRDELLAAQVAQRVLELHQLDEQIVLRVERRRMHRALEIEREPLLDAGHA